MPTRDRYGHVAPPAPETVEALALRLEAVADDDFHAEPYAVGILGTDPDGVDLTAHPLEGPDPVEDLVGFKAPRTWQGFGVCSCGTAYDLAEPAASAAGRAERASGRRVRMVHLVFGSGDAVSVVRQQGETDARLSRHSGSEPLGRVDDYCRRVLRLPTAPPERDVRELWALDWLTQILTDIWRGDPPQSWHQVATRHKAAALLTIGGDPSALGPPFDAAGRDPAPHLRQLGDAFAEQMPWDRLWRFARRRRVGLFGVAAHDVAWHDVGSFSRSLLGWFPELGELLDAVGGQLDTALTNQIKAVLEDWHLPSR